MTTQDLTNLITTAITAINTNRTLIANGLLDKVDSTITEIKGSTLIQGAVAGIVGITTAQVASLLDQATQVVAFERTLIANGNDLDLAKFLTNLKSHPTLLKGLAYLA